MMSLVVLYWAHYEWYYDEYHKLCEWHYAEQHCGECCYDECIMMSGIMMILLC